MAAAPESAGTGKGLIGWIDARFPLTKMWNEHVAEYYAPKNLTVPPYAIAANTRIVIGVDDASKPVS